MSLKHKLLKVFYIILKYLLYAVFPYKEYLYQNNEKKTQVKKISLGREEKINPTKSCQSIHPILQVYGSVQNLK